MVSQEVETAQETAQNKPDSFGWEGLLRTKVHIPTPRTSSINRPRLVNKLSGARDIKLFLFSAPAGFGKTTLVSEWVAGLQKLEGAPNVTWLSLDGSDNDLALFWRYIITALQSIDREIGHTLIPLFSQPPIPPVSAWLPVFINDLYQSTRRFLIVLDDYHVIRNRNIHESIHYLLQHMPNGGQLALLTRADPPLPLARLRVQEEILEFRAEDLLFTRHEVADLLNNACDLAIPEDDLDVLERHTQGWAAGLYLAARSLKGCDPARRHEFIRSFSGSDHSILNYLFEEVLNQQPPVVRNFLLRTSILSRLSEGLCSAISGETVDTAGQILARLAHDQLFILPLDSEGVWYCYHPLFAEALETRLRETDKFLWDELHRQACHWYLCNDQVESAIGHALAGKDYGVAATLIESEGNRAWSSGNITAPLRWLEGLPEIFIEERISLQLLKIWALILNDRWEEATNLWQRAGHVIDLNQARHTEHVRGVWAAIGGVLGGYRQLPEEAVRYTQKALTQLPESEYLWRAVSQYTQGLAYQAQGKVDLAADTYRITANLCLSQGIYYLAIAATAHLIEISFVQGKLYEVQANCERLSNLGGNFSIRDKALGVNGDICLGRLAYERNELDAAEQYLLKGLAAIYPGGLPQVTLGGRFTLARLYEARGNFIQARQQLEAALETSTRLGLPVGEVTTRALMARLAFRQGHWDDVRCWQATSGLSADDLPSYPREVGHEVLAEILIAEKHYAQAETLLSRLIAAAERMKRTGSLINLLLLYALSLAGQKRLPEVERTLRRSLTLAQPQGYVRTFLDHGQPLIELLDNSAVRRHSPDYVEQLCRAWRKDIDAKRLASSNHHPKENYPGSAFPSLTEDLTPRESEILTMISRGASNQEIAEELVLSVGTVKGHVNHIFSKLNVHNRTAAVARARDHELIDT